MAASTRKPAAKPRAKPAKPKPRRARPAKSSQAAIGGRRRHAPGTIFDAETLARGMAELSARDKRAAALFARFPAEPREAPRNLFHNLCRTVSAQLLSNAAAGAIFGRVTALCGGELSPAALDRLADGALREAGLSFSKIRTLRTLADTCRDDGHIFGTLQDADDAEVFRAVTAIKGLGPWSAEMFMLFSLGRTDVYSPRDAALATGLRKLKRLRADTPVARLETVARRYSPYRSVLSLSLWKWRHNNWAPLG